MTTRTLTVRSVPAILAATSIVVGLLVSPASADGEKPSETADGDTASRLFAERVFPLLQERCLGCHGKSGKRIKGELEVTSREALLKGGESGDPAIVPGDPGASLLLEAVTWQNDDLQMPPKENDRLSEREIGWLREWIASGAPWVDAAGRQEILDAGWNAGETADGIRVPTSGGLTPEWTQRRYRPEDLWAFRPLRKPEVPHARDGAKEAARSHPVDAFLDRKLAEAGLEPAPPADRRTWIRRVSYTLTGLPPTASEIEEFLADRKDGAHERVIDRLLASPHYGEHWARHWLDVVRYADSSGYANDYERPNAWRYRDYVIRSFNADKPFDRFIIEQLAGDELEPDNPEMLIAVGFLRMGPWEHTGMSVAAVTRQLFLDDVTNIVGQSFLGQELRCARCHDHKFDPIPTRDYYRIQSVFAPVQLADRKVDFLPDENLSAFPEERAAVERRLSSKGLEGIDNTEDEKKGLNKVRNKRKAYLERERARFEPYALSVYNGPLHVQNSYKALMKMPGEKQLKGDSQQVYILSGGSIESPLEEVTPATLSATDFGEGFGKPLEIPETLEGRRLALARWIASDDNPLTARVFVNRVWQYHFGRGLAANPNNFGKTGDRPSHPRLLDWLASWFVEHDWSVKELHRLILGSQAFRRSSEHPDPESVERIDSNNELLSHFSPRRLAAEEIRDSMLLASGELNPEIGGLPSRPELNMEVALQPRHIMGSVAPAYQPSRTPRLRNRRTIYSMKIRTLRDPMLEVFNQPGTETSCERRDTSTVTPQVFSLFNSQESYDRALALAARAAQKRDALDGQVALCFEYALGRTPTTAEKKRCLTHVRSMTSYHREHPPEPVEPPRFVVREMVEEMTGLNFRWRERLDAYDDYVADLKPWEVAPRVRALADLCLVLFNSNEFVYVY